jgi:hypothetical protein
VRYGRYSPSEPSYAECSPLIIFIKTFSFLLDEEANAVSRLEQSHRQSHFSINLHKFKK